MATGGTRVTATPKLNPTGGVTAPATAVAIANNRRKKHGTPIFDKYVAGGGKLGYVDFVAARKTAVKDRATKTPVDPLAWLNPSSEESVDASVKAETYGKYHPLFQQITQARREDVAGQKRIDDWYGAYAKEVEAGRVRTQEGYTNAAKGINDASVATEQRAGADQAALQEKANADAASRGVTAADLSGVASQASRSREASAGSYAAMLASQGAAQNARTGKELPARKFEAHQAQSNRRTALERKVFDLVKEQGAYRIEAKDRRRREERASILERSLFNLKSDTAGSDAEAAAAKVIEDARVSGRDYNLERDKLKETTRGHTLTDKQKTAALDKKTGPTLLTPARKASYRAQYAKAARMLADYTVAEIRKLLPKIRSDLAKAGLDDGLVSATINNRLYGGSDDAFRRRVFANTGFSVPRRGSKTKTAPSTSNGLQP